jgi:hypothetical protein
MYKVLMLFAMLTTTRAQAQFSSQERLELQATIEAMFNAVDAREWSACEALFEQQVTADYQSLSGQPPITISPKELVVGWQQVLPGFLGTQHMLSNFQIHPTAPSTAEVQFYGQAFHYLPNDKGDSVWTVVGNYLAILEKSDRGWQIRAIRFNLLFQSGNLQLPVLAAERVKKSN